MSPVLPDQESLTKALAQLTSGPNKSKSLNINGDELKRLENAFSNKCFADMITDYVKEISDPTSRAEKDAYLKLLEEQNDVPLNKKVIHPKTGFVIKFKINQDCDEKIFVNVVHSDDIDQPSSRNEDGKGSHWNIPFIIGPKRFELDKKKRITITYDFCFHSMTVGLGATKKGFLKLIINLVMDAVNQQLRYEGKKTIENLSYHILRNVKYINGSPSIMLIPSLDPKADVLENTIDSQDGIKDNSKQDPKNVLSHEVIQKVHVKNDILKKGFLMKDCNQTKKVDGPKEPIVPHFDVIERGNFDLIDHTIEGNHNVSTRPHFLEYRISLPSIKSEKELDLKVTEQRLELSTSSNASSGKKYLLKVKFPYPVLHDDGIAKFDTDSFVLVITLPVVRPTSVHSNHDRDHAIRNDTTPETISDVYITEGNKNTSKYRERMPKHDHRSDGSSSCIKTGTEHSRWIKTDQNNSFSTRESFASKQKIPTLEESFNSSNTAINTFSPEQTQDHDNLDLCGTLHVGTPSNNNSNDDDDRKSDGSKNVASDDARQEDLFDIKKIIFQLD